VIHPVSRSFRSASYRRHDLTWQPEGLRSIGSRIGRAIRVEAGSSIVEFALASIILFTLVFGVIAICLALYTYNVVAEAARDGSRYAMVRGSQCNSFADCPNVSSTQIQTYVQGVGFPGIDSSSLTVAATWPDGNEKPGSRVAVTVSYNFPLSIPFVPNRTLAMASTSQVVISQ
jgi:Flp pilus assembly protein TadG